MSSAYNKLNFLYVTMWPQLNLFLDYPAYYCLSTESFVCHLVHYISVISPTSNLETSLLQIECYDLAKPFMLHNLCPMKYLDLPMELKFSPPLLLLHLNLLRCFFSLPLFLSLCLSLSLPLLILLSPPPSPTLSTSPSLSYLVRWWCVGLNHSL